MAKAPSPPPTPGSDESDPSMDDILASIRRILDEDQGVKPADGDVLMLDPSMMVDEPHASTPVVEPAAPVDAPPVAPVSAPVSPALAAPAETHHNAPVSNDEPSYAPTISREATSVTTLVAPEAAAAAAQSVGTLMRTLAAERNTAVSRGGVTIEDLVREEIRPLLKAWLDTHLPPVVERAVRAEIERVVGRQTG